MRKWRIEVNDHSSDDYSTQVTVSCKLPKDYIKKLEEISKLTGDELALTFTKCLFFGVSDYVQRFEKGVKENA